MRQSAMTKQQLQYARHHLPTTCLQQMRQAHCKNNIFWRRNNSAEVASTCATMSLGYTAMLGLHLQYM